jgi:pimeloyl-ACP methyl ester carboxylesterase
MEGQVGQLIGMMDSLGIEEAILMGNSAGGTIAFETALSHPERVLAIIAVDAAVYTEGNSRAWIQPLLDTPQMRHLGPLIARQIEKRGDAFIRTAWHDPDLITEEVYQSYREPLQVENWDRALWELTAARGENDLADRIKDIGHPTLVITGDDDRIVPTEQSLRLAEELPNASLAVLRACGHVPQEECPEAFLEAVFEFLDWLDPEL